MVFIYYNHRPLKIFLLKYYLINFSKYKANIFNRFTIIYETIQKAKVLHVLLVILILMDCICNHRYIAENEIFLLRHKIFLKEDDLFLLPFNESNFSLNCNLLQSLILIKKILRIEKYTFANKEKIIKIKSAGFYNLTSKS